MAYVYKHIRLDTNSVFYIGIGTTKNYKRAYSTYNRNQYWLNIVNKFGFRVEIIEDNLEWDDACKAEQYWISYYGRWDLNEGSLVNMTGGGDGAPNVSDSVRKSISEKAKNRLSIKENNGMFGKRHSEYSKLKMRERLRGTRIGRKRSKESVMKTNEKLRGRVFSDEHREKMSVANKNRNVLTCPHCGISSTHNMNRYHFDNCKMINPTMVRTTKGCWLGYVRVTDTTGDVKIYNSASHVAKELSLDLHSVLTHSKNGTYFKYGKCKGWRFELLKEKENNGN
jgi:hypothetical protein